MRAMVGDQSQVLRCAGGARSPKLARRARRRALSDDLLLEDLTRVAKVLGTQTLSQTQYESVGRYSFVTYCRRFGSWKLALLRVKLEPAHLMNVSADELLGDIRRVALKLKTRQLRFCEYIAHGRYSRKIIRRLFGRWQSAAEAARLTPVIQRPQDYAELFENLRAVWQKLGRQPRYVELRPPLSRFSASTYAYRFGSFTDALKAFEHFAKPGFATAPVVDPRSVGFTKRGPRTINLRLRFIILRRDRFKCCACGRSPATHAGLSLQIDHIVPWSQGGETIESNLQTLCDQCNHGKSDLAWEV